MSIIIQDWLMHVIGELMDNATITKRCRNGYLIAQVLYDYDIIKAVQFNWILNNNDKETLKKNFHLLQIWLKFVNVDLTDEIIDDLKNCNESTTASLIFKMYLNMNDRDVMYNNTEIMKKMQNIYVNHTRFDLQKVHVSENDEDADDDAADSGTQILSTHDKYVNVLTRRRNHIFKWYKVKMRSISEKLSKLKEECRENLHKMYDSNETKRISFKTYGSCQISIPTAPLNETHGIKNKMTQMRSAEDIFKDVKRKTAAKHKSDVFTSQMVQNLVGDVFQHILTEFNKEIDSFVTDMILKKSNYELQMMQKLCEANDMKYVVLEDHKHYIKKADYYKTWLDFTMNTRIKDRYVLAYDLYCHEITRNKDLHQRLAESMRTLNDKRTYDFCKELCISIVDQALRHIEFHDTYNYYPMYSNQMYWKALFIKGKSCTDHVDDFFELTYYNDDEETDLTMKKNFRLEIDRQNAMADSVMEEYVYDRLYYYKTHLEDIIDCQDQIKKTNIILSKLLRTFKLAKYPLTVKDKPNLPKFEMRACIVGLNDQSVLPILRKLMSNHKIAIIEMKNAINYCMETYIKEDQHFSIENIFMEITKDTLNFMRERKDPILRNTDKKWRLVDKSVGHCVNSEYIEKMKQKFNKATQLTNMDTTKLSKVGELGRLAYLFLYTGAHIPNKDLISMFVEYLKTLKDYNGWILINYPLTIKDAVYMEECLTGVLYHGKFKKHVEIECLTDLEWRHINYIPQRDLYINKRDVLLFENYNDQLEADPYYETYLTSFILMQSTIDNCQDMPTFTLRKDEINDLYDFYSSKGIYYSYQYNQLSYDTLEDFAKRIIQIYMNAVKQEEDEENEEAPIFKKLGEKLVKPVQRFDYTKIQPPANPKVDKKKKTKKDKTKKNKNVAVALKLENKGTQLPEVEDVIDKANVEKVIINHLPVTISKPFQIMLATFWENIEHIVTKDVGSLFFGYRTFIEDHEKFSRENLNIMRDYLSRPHDKQEHLQKFQLEYVNLEDEYRNDEEVKAEYFYRVNELHDTLKNITDELNEDRVAYKKTLLWNEWMPRSMWIYGHGHSYLLQVELMQQRGLLQILNDYYVGVATKFPCTKSFRNIKLDKLPIEKFKDFHSYVYRCVNHEDVITDDNIFNRHLKSNYQLAQSLIDEYKSQCNSVIKEMENLFKNREKSSKFNENADVELFPNLINEWRELVDGLTAKCSVRLLTLTRRSEEKIFTLLSSHIGLSSTMDNLIKERYDNEMISIKTMCEVLYSAIEAEVPIIERMVLIDDKFYVDPKVHMKLDPMPSLKVQREPANAYKFSLESLDTLIALFKKLAPAGLLHERCFTYVLYDIIKKKTNLLVPSKWHTLTLDVLSHVVGLLFENNTYVDWHDFILYNLDVPYPKISDMLRAKRHFRRYDENLTETIPFYHMYHAKFWIDNNTELELNFIKLLCNLYETRYEYVNYGRMLLGFCKDHDPMKGFLKAVQLCLGAFVCMDGAETSQFISKAYGQCFNECICSDASCGLDSTNHYVSAVTIEQESIESEEETIEFSEATQSSESTRKILEGQSKMNELFLDMINTTVTPSTYKEESLSEETIIEECGSYCKCANPETMEWIAGIASCECSTDTVCQISSNILLETEEIVQLCDICEDYDKKIPIVYTISYDLLVKILSVTIYPQQSGKTVHYTDMKNIKEIYEECRNPDFMNKVFTHVLFNNVNFKKFIGQHYKFLSKNVQRILNSAIKCNTK